VLSPTVTAQLEPTAGSAVARQNHEKSMLLSTTVPAVPTGFDLLRALEIDLVGVRFAQSAALSIPRPAGLISVMTSRFQFADLGTWTINKTWYNGAPQYPGKGSYVAYAGKSNWGFYDGHAKSMNPCSTFGKLNWTLGQEPADDFLWEWWTGVDPTILRDWQQGATPGYQPNDYGCVDIEEYR